MKRFLVLSLFLVLNFTMAYVIGCTPKGVPVITTIPPTHTPTVTATFTNTPGGPTNTPTSTPVGQVIFNDSLHVATGESEFDGGGGATTTSNLTDTTYPHAGTVDALWVFTTLGTGGYEGWNVTSPTTNLSTLGLTVCTFWAKSSRTFAGNGIEFFGGGGADNGGNVNHVEAVMTTYTLFSFTLPQPLDQVTTPFGLVINNSDVSDLVSAGPLSIYVDDIYYQ